MSKVNVVRPNPTPTWFNITLNENEAFTLLCVLNRVGGDPTNSARGYIDQLRSQLACEFDYEGYPHIHEQRNTVYFTNDNEHHKMGADHLRTSEI